MTDWIEWHGGENPVPGRVVDVRCRDRRAMQCGPQLSEHFQWFHDDDERSDIIAYRLAAQPASEQVGTDEPSGEGVNPNPDLQELLGRLRAVGTESFNRKESIIGIITEAADAIEALLADLARKDAALRPFAAEHECDGHATVRDFDLKVSITVPWSAVIEARQALETKAGGASSDDAGRKTYRVGEFIGRHPVLCIHGHIDPNNLCTDCEGG